MRTSRTHRHSSIDTPSYNKVLEMFNDFTGSEINQLPTKNKWEEEDTGIVSFFETVFENEHGKMTVRYYLTDTEEYHHNKANRYSCVFENNNARLGIFISNTARGGDTIRAYDGNNYFLLPEGYLMEKESLEGISNFVLGIAYLGEEEDINEFFLNIN